MTSLYVSLLVCGAFAEDLFYAHLKKHLNHQINPCDDFYGHVCKGPMLPNETIISK